MVPETNCVTEKQVHNVNGGGGEWELKHLCLSLKEVTVTRWASETE